MFLLVCVCCFFFIDAPSPLPPASYYPHTLHSVASICSLSLSPSCHSFLSPALLADRRDCVCLLLLSVLCVCMCARACVCGVCVSEMKQSHMPVSSGGSIMEDCYLLPHITPSLTLAVCVCVAGKVPVVPLSHTQRLSLCLNHGLILTSAAQTGCCLLEPCGKDTLS